MEKELSDYFNKKFLSTIEIILNKSENLFNNCYNPFNLRCKSVNSESSIDKTKLKWYFKFLSLNSNIDWKVIESNPKKHWDYNLLSINENINYDIINDNKDRNWNLNYYAHNKNLKDNEIDLIQKSNRINEVDSMQRIFIYTFSSNENFNLDDLNKYHKKYELDWNSLSQNKFLTFDFVKNNLEKNWNWSKIIDNPNVINHKTIKKINEIGLNYRDILGNSSFKYEYLKKLLPNDFSYMNFSRNINMDWNLVCENPLKDWDWDSLSRNESLIWNIVKNNLHLPWNWAEISKHKCVKIQTIKENINLQWSWESISSNPNINPFFVLENYSMNWSISNLTFNDMKSGKRNFIKKNLDLFTSRLLVRLFPIEIINQINEYF